MTLDGELAAVRAVARQLRGTTRPPDARRLSALASSLDHSCRSLQRGYEFLREEAAGRVRTVELGDPEPYRGLTVQQAVEELARRALVLGGAWNGQAAMSADLSQGIGREAASLLAAIAPRLPESRRSRRGVSSGSPDASGPGKARSEGSETSRAAALAAEPRTGTNRRAVLDAVAAVARDPRTVGLTDVEIQRATGLNPNSARPRRVELVDGGWLADSGETREHHGREHTVWVLTDRAAAWVVGHALSA